MGRKRNPVLPVFTRDILSSPKCRALSESAAGIYFFLLCRLNEPPTPGAYRLSDWELHPTWKRSKTQQCLATPDKYECLQFFASLLAKNDLPWKQKNILSGLQELYKYGIIVVEGDMLVQPRMFKDNGFELPDLDNDGDPVGTILDDPTSGSMALRGDNDFTQNNGANNGAENSTKKGTEKVHQKDSVSHAPAHSKERGDRDNNKGIIGGVGVKTSDKPKTQGNNPKGENGAYEVVEVGGVSNLPQEEQKRATKPEKSKNGAQTASSSKKKKPSVTDAPPTLEEVQAYFDERAQQGKPFVYVTPDGFYDACCQSGWTLKDGKPIRDWKARVRTFENFRKEHGDKPIGHTSPQQFSKSGDPVPATKPTAKKYKDKW